MLDIACHPWIPLENSLGLYGVCGPESVWSANGLACPAPTSTSSRTDIEFSSTLFSHQLPPLNSAVDFWQLSPLHHPFVHEEAALDRAGETLIPHSVPTVPLPEWYPTPKPATRSLNKHVSASRLVAQSVSPRPRRTPYPLGADFRKRTDLPTSVYLCQWFDGAGRCGAPLTGTKSAITQHLQEVHTIRLKADKTTHVCLWNECHKPMRGESIARHILTVHMQDKVPCPRCGSRFARVDSMQRHQRTCLSKEGYTSDACNDPVFDT